MHIHSKYSRACSRELDLPNLARHARRKGITLLGTGDFTHPAWLEHLRQMLRPAEPGLFRLDPQVDRDIARQLPPRLASLVETDPVRFLLSAEISTIYKHAGRTRKVHHLIYLPDLDAVERFNARLGRGPGGIGGNLASDGRPILGLDSRDLLEIALEVSSDAYLVPAHIWTPWFSALGSKSGFDAIADCYADLADHIFAVETGLSSDPAMNWRVSSLDSYHLVSNSDAHSLPALAREATLLDTALDYFAIREALRTGDGLAGTIEFFPEEGKYHADGHRACGVNWQPQQTRAAGGRCPECGGPLTVGVLSRVEDLADRPKGMPSPRAKSATHLVQLPEVLGEIYQVGPRSKTVQGHLNTLVAALGPELHVLTQAPLDEVGRVGGELLAEALDRLRRGQVRRTPGYDGEYGIIRLFDPEELAGGSGAGRRAGSRGLAGGGRLANGETLFDLPAAALEPATAQAPREVPKDPTGKTAKRLAKQVPPVPPAPPIAPMPSPHEPFEPMLAGMEEVGTGLLDKLDVLQRVAASAPGGPLLIVAGPGTGKTRTLTHRIAYLCAELGVPPANCLAITFTRRAAEELRERLDSLLGPVANDVTVATFHSLGLAILRENATAAGLPKTFRVADEPERETIRLAARAEAGDDDAAYRKLLRAADLVDLDELVTLPLELLREDPELTNCYRARWPWIFVDEYQDVDPVQYELLRRLCPADGNICAIGDPDQAIYSFRGADVSFFLRFAEDFTDARVVRLTRNYRSTAPILAAAVQAIAPSTLVRGRRLDPARVDPEAPLVGRYHATSAADEADFVARTVDELVGGVSHRSLDSGRVDSRVVTPTELSFSDIAVLYRTDAQSAAIVDALSRANIPVQKRSHDRLRDRAGVAAIAQELRLANGLGGSIAARVRLAGQVLAQRYLTPALSDATAPPVRAEDVWAAVDLLTPLARRCGDDLDLFLYELATGAEVDALDPRAEAVTLLTLHAAKGLEFPVVFIVGCEEGLLPLRLPGRSTPAVRATSGRAADDADQADLADDGIAEERRLFFVGLTRARSRLFISHASWRSRYGAERQARPSRFLDDIDDCLFDRLGEAGPRRPRDRQLRLL